MKKSALEKLVKEAISEVLNEVITEPVDKDPNTMNPDEKKQAVLKAQQASGATDPTTPVDLIQKEAKGKIREMARPAYIYKLADDWQSKLPLAKSKYSDKKGKWFDVIIKGIEDNGGKSTIGNIARQLGLRQQALNAFGTELYDAGVTKVAGIVGRNEPEGDEEINTDTPSQEFVPQHAKKFYGNDGEELPSEPTSLSSIFGPDAKNSGEDVDSLFIGSGFSDDFDNGTLGYDVTDPTSMEPDEEDGIERSGSSASGLTPDQSEILDRYDRLVQIISNIRGNLKSTSRIYRRGVDEVVMGKDEEDVSLDNQKELLKRKRQELANLLRIHGDLIAKYRDLGKLKSLIKTIEKDELPDEFSDIELDEATKERMRKLANINKKC